MLLEPRPDRLRRLARFLRKVSSGVWRGRRRRSANQFVEHPCPAQYRRRAIAIRTPHQDRGLAQQSRPLFSGQRDFAELRAEDSWNPVVPGQTFIQESVVGGKKIQYAAVLQKDAADERFRFSGEIMP